jgi:hypothetical protein
MFTILNRLRGTYGWMSKVTGIILGLLVYAIFDNYYVAIAVTLGYVLGESFGWGDWVGELSVNKTNKAPAVTTDGVNNGIFFLANKIIDYRREWTEYCRLALAIRGMYWWLCLIPLYWVGVNAMIIVIAILLLAVGFPIACELGYRSRDIFGLHKIYNENKKVIGSKIVYKGKVKKTLKQKIFFIEGGWEHQELYYGIMQDIVILFIVGSVI